MMAAPRSSVTDRVAWSVTAQVGRAGWSAMSPASSERAVIRSNDTVIADGSALIDADGDRIEPVDALGVDEVLSGRLGRWRTTVWSTSIVDGATGQLVDVRENSSSAGLCDWLAQRPAVWLDAMAWPVPDFSRSWRLGFDTRRPATGLVADPFQVVKFTYQRLDEVGRRVQNEILG